MYLFVYVVISSSDPITKMSPKIHLEHRIQSGLKNVPDSFSEWRITNMAVGSDSCHHAFESYFDYSIIDSVESIFS